MQPEWKSNLPTPTQLLLSPFGQPDEDHSFTQVASFRTTLFLVLKYCHEYLDASSKSDLLSLRTLINHMDTMLTFCATYDFTWIWQHNLLWEKQEHINPEKVKACMSCLFHYDLDVSPMTRYLGTPPYWCLTQIPQKISCISNKHFPIYFLLKCKITKLLSLHKKK